MQKQSERWLIVAAILLASLLATVALVSTLENASFLAGLVSAVIATVALLAVYRRERSDPEPAAGGAVQSAGFARLFTGRQWLTVAAGVVACGVVGAAVSLSGAGDSGDGENASNNGPLTPTTASTTPSVALTDASPTGTAESTDTPESTDRPTPDPTGEVSEEPTAPVDDTQPVAPIVYLDALQPAQGDRNTGPVLFAGKQYPRSVETYCWHANSDSVEWNVAGYRKFTTTLGVDDNAKRASGRTAQFTFYNQDGRKLAGPYDVSLGRSRAVSIDLAGAVRLQVTCGGRETRTNEVEGLYGAMGDALITK
ncbi:NPCBM/NEW2 domain-containing protein [Micromonospora purpureochromogenes]|uniref:NPCBM/NEW2 domain-containing protein n=1 Tax=Micromonospora purpureochromogenes TaxID=47872 RepID=UPI0033CE13EA